MIFSYDILHNSSFARRLREILPFPMDSYIYTKQSFHVTLQECLDIFAVNRLIRENNQFQDLLWIMDLTGASMKADDLENLVIASHDKQPGTPSDAYITPVMFADVAMAHKLNQIVRDRNRQGNYHAPVIIFHSWRQFLAHFYWHNRKNDRLN